METGSPIIDNLQLLSTIEPSTETQESSNDQSSQIPKLQNDLDPKVRVYNRIKKFAHISGTAVGLLALDTISAPILKDGTITDFTRTGTLVLSSVVGAAAGYVGSRLFTEYIDSI